MNPIAGLLLIAWDAYLFLRSRKITAAKALRAHRPNGPATGHDKGAIARSAMHGLGNGGSH